MNAFIKAFIMTADNGEILCLGKVFGIGLLERFTLGAGDDYRRIRFSFNCLKAGKDGLGLEHHAGTATVGGVIDATVLVLAKFTGIVAQTFDQSGFSASADNAGLAIAID